MPLHCPRGYIFSPPETRRTFSLSRLHSLDDEEVFNLPLHCPRDYIFSPPETRRTFSLSRLHSLNGGEVFYLPLHCPKGYIFSPPGTWRTFYSFSPPLAQRRGGLLLASGRARALRSFIWCLRSPKDDEDFKNFNWRACDISFLALNHVQVTRSCFKTLENSKHAI